MTVEDFRDLFSGNTPNLNWSKAVEEGWKVETRVVTEHEVLEDYCSCVTVDGLRGFGGRSLLFREITGDMSKVGFAWRKKVYALAAGMDEQQQTMIVPALGETIFDGNHRIVALLLHRLKFAVMICTLVPKGGALWRVEDYGPDVAEGWAV